MKGQWKGFISGIVVTLLLGSLIISAAATAGRRTVNVDYNNIKVTLDGKQVNLVDANGNAVEPFAINGTTYLPVRAVAGALGLEVGWDQATTTVILSSEKTTASTNGPIGAPGVGVSIDTSVLGGPISATVDYADGVKLLWIAKNNSGKTINYYTIHLAFYNPVGDPAYDEITRQATKAIRYVGPVAPGEDLVAYEIVTYSAVCSKITITEIDLVYSDGTKETVPYGYSTPAF